MRKNAKTSSLRMKSSTMRKRRTRQMTLLTNMKYLRDLMSESSKRKKIKRRMSKKIKSYLPLSQKPSKNIVAVIGCR